MFSVAFVRPVVWSFFFFNDTATTEIYTLSLHDALPISKSKSANPGAIDAKPMVITIASNTPYLYLGDKPVTLDRLQNELIADRKSTRLNSSHSQISYAVFCLKKKTRYVHDWPDILT